MLTSLAFIFLVGLALPWGLMAAGRYLPGGPWLRAAACCAWTGLWVWLSPWAVDRIMLANGWNDSQPYGLSGPLAALGAGPGPLRAVGAVIAVLWTGAAALAAVGLLRAFHRK